MARIAATFAAVTALNIGLGAVSPVSAQEDLPWADQKWVSVSGKITSVGVDTFKLDFGDGIVTVEYDEFGDFDEVDLPMGSKVTVYGEIDNDLYEKRRIEASSVFVDATNTFHYASAADEETPEPTAPVWIGVPGSDVDADVAGVTVTGTILDVDGRSFSLDAGGAPITVNTNSLGYNPLDSVGFPELDKGDVVQVSGELATSFLDDKKLVADDVTLIEESPEV